MAAPEPDVTFHDRHHHWLQHGFSDANAPAVAKAESLVNRTLDPSAAAELLRGCERQYEVSAETGDVGGHWTVALALKQAWTAFRDETWRAETEEWLKTQKWAPVVARDYARACMQLGCKYLTPDEMRAQQREAGQTIIDTIRAQERARQDPHLMGKERLLLLSRLQTQVDTLKARYLAALGGLAAHMRQQAITARQREGQSR